jgi:hypothetical protein
VTLALEVAPLDDDEVWDRAWASCPYATHFHSREWAEAWSACTGGALRPAPLRASFSDGAEAILPLSRESRRGGLVRRYVSSPAGTFGGWLSDTELEAGHRALLAERLAGGLGDITWRVSPYGGLDFLERLGDATPDETQAIALGEGMDAVVRRWTKGHRSAASKARREGVTVSLARGAEDWRAFRAIHDDSVRRWGESASVAHPPGLLEEIRSRESPHVRLWLASHDGRPVAGALCLYAGRHASYWLGGALEEHFSVRPVHLLLHEAIAHACESGLDWFDLNPSGGHAGVDAIKKGFGAVRLPSPVVAVTGARARALSGARSLLRLRGRGAGG